MTAKVVMAAGAFTLGSSIELSADAPIREPYYAWIQGGLNFHSAKLCAMLAAQKNVRKRIVEIMYNYSGIKPEIVELFIYKQV